MTHPFSTTERDAVILYDLILTLLAKAEIYDDGAIILASKMMLTSGVDKTTYHFVFDLINHVREINR